MAGSYACACVTPITVWIVSKNKSNCLLENKMIYIILEMRQITVVCSVKHSVKHGLLISYITMYIINSQFLSQINQIITVNSSMNAPISETS